MMTDAELRALVIDCLAVWGVRGRVRVGMNGIEIDTSTASDGIARNTALCCVLRRAAPGQHPVRWVLETPAQRKLRATPSIVAALNALRNMVAATRDLSPE